MVLTAGQVTAFFEDAGQMGLEPRTRVHLQGEGIVTIEDLAEFTDKDTWYQITENCKRPPQVMDAAGVLVNQPAFHIGAKSLHRLRVAAVAVEYYAATDRAITTGAVQWNTALKNFEVQWKAIKSAKDDDSPEAPKMSKTVGMVKWLEAYEGYAKQRIGVRNAPLAYVLRENVAVPATAPALQAGQPHSDEHGSVREEMIARLSHTHGLYNDDNALVWDDIEAATRGTKFAPTIAPFKKSKNGRAAYLALMKQHAGPAMWDKEVKECMDFLLNRKFTGGTSFTLERFLSQHRAAFVSLQRCAENVQVEIPNERTRVGYVIDNIENNDSLVQAAIAAVKLDDGPTGLRNDFEAAVAYLLPVDPVKKKQKKRPNAEISAANATNKGSLKTSKGPKTGVELRYYAPKEFAKLSTEEISELKELRNASKKSGGTDKSSNKKNAKFRASVVKAVTKQIREEEEEKAQEQTTIDAISGILKLNASAVAGGGKQPMVAQPPAKKNNVAFKEESDEAQIAAIRLFQLMNSHGSRQHGKGVTGKGK